MPRCRSTLVMLLKKSDQHLRTRSPNAGHCDGSWNRPTLEICARQWNAATAPRRHSTLAGVPGRQSRRLQWFQIETETAEAELAAERTASAQLQFAQLATVMAESQARSAIAESPASSRQRLHDLHRQSTPPPTLPKSPRSSRGSPRVRSPSPPTDSFPACNLPINWR